MKEDLEFVMCAVDSYGPIGPTWIYKTVNSVQVCGLIMYAGLWADILLRLIQIQTVGFAMFRLLCYVLHNSVAKPGACTCFYIFVPSVHKKTCGQTEQLTWNHVFLFSKALL